MPKKIIEVETQEIYKTEEIDQFDTSEKTIISKYSNEKERKDIFEDEKFLYFTPISNEKKRRFIPSTPQKERYDKENNITINIKGKNLLSIFESM